MRLDRALVERGIARSRSHAQELLAGGVVTVAGKVEARASRLVSDTDEIDAPRDHYVSRAAHKLIGALDALGPQGLVVEGALALDAGASTGGFTQVLLERGAARVVAIDVGHDQLDASLRADTRVDVHEGLNVRDLAPGAPGSGSTLVVGDLSFISLSLVVGPLRATASKGADFLLLVKPQFEVGRAGLDKHGVVSSPKARALAVASACAALEALGLHIHAIHRSVVPGPAGNVEFFVWASETWQAGDSVSRPQLAGEALADAIRAQVEGER